MRTLIRRATLGCVLAVASGAGAPTWAAAESERQGSAPVRPDCAPSSTTVCPCPALAAGAAAAASASDNSHPDNALPCRLAAVVAAAGDDAGVTLRAANGAFANRPLDLFPAFSAVLRDRFGARVERLDFSDSGAVTRINTWVARATRGAVPELVSHLEPDAALVLANAMHFHGKWSRSFDPADTVPLPFHPRPGTAIEVAMMQSHDLSARYREDAQFQAVVLPYGGGEFALVVVLPRAGIEHRPPRYAQWRRIRPGWARPAFAGCAAIWRCRA